MTSCSTCDGELVDGVCARCTANARTTLIDASVPLQETLDAVTFHGAASSPSPVGTPRVAWTGGEVLFDEYVVERSLGEGGMGAVYLVASRHSGQRHAVKRTRCVDPDAREALLAEVSIWRDLPEHPNLASCHFFRTLGDDVLIFAEYVDGGSLDQALEADPAWDPRKRADIALQFAFGLEAAHSAGYVHQDVKPGNVLITGDGVVKVTDFGLARTQQILASGQGPAGLTPAFCSPEQAFRDQAMTAATDIWSWGISVLQLYIGEIRWQTGIFAPGVFELYRAGKLTGAPCTMPDGLAEIVQLCFKHDIEERWQNSTALGNALVAWWNEEYGTPYERPRIRHEAASQRSVRASRSSRARIDPRVWLDEMVPSPSELGEAGQLALFERAARKLRSGVETGEFAHDELVRLLIEKGRAHHQAHDWPGALDTFEQAASLATDDLDRADIAGGRAWVQYGLRRFESAQAHFLEAIGLLDELGDNPDRLVELRVGLAECRWNGRLEEIEETVEAVFASIDGRDDPLAREREFRARALVIAANQLAAQNRRAETVPLYREAIEHYEDLILLEGRAELRPRLGSAYFNAATGMMFERANDEALELFERSMALFKDVVSKPSGRHHLADYAHAQTNFSVLLRRLGEIDRAEEVLRNAVGILERVVHLEGRRDIEDRLTSAYLNLSTVVSHRDNYAEALDLAERVVVIRRRLVEIEGRTDLRARLAAVIGNRGYFLSELDQNVEAIESYRESIAIREEMLGEGDDSVVSGLARQYTNRAALHVTRGVWDDALADSERAMELFETVDETRSSVAVESLFERSLALYELGDVDRATEVHRASTEILSELAEAGYSSAQLAELEIRASAQHALLQGSEADLSGIADEIADHDEATVRDKSRALLLLSRAAAARDDARSSLSAVVARASSLPQSPSLVSQRLELAYYRSLAAGEALGVEQVAALRHEAARTGRVALRRIVTALELT